MRVGQLRARREDRKETRRQIDRFCGGSRIEEPQLREAVREYLVHVVGTVRDLRHPVAVGERRYDAYNRRTKEFNEFKSDSKPRADQLAKDRVVARSLKDHTFRYTGAKKFTAGQQAAIDDFNVRVKEARRQLLGGPPVVTQLRDPYEAVRAWRERRLERARRVAEEQERRRAEEAAPGWRERRRRRRAARSQG